MSAVRYESFDRIAVVTIDQPEKRNALSRQVVDELAEAWRRFAESTDRVAVLTATGDKAFTVGADLNDIPHDLWRGVPGIGVELDKPVIGAVAGWVVGGGLVLANQCDLLVIRRSCIQRPRLASPAASYPRSPFACRTRSRWRHC